MSTFNREAAGEMFWELYKTVHGMRPRGHRFYSAETSDAEAEEIFNHYAKWSDDTLAAERAREILVMAQFEKDIANIQAVVNCCREQAIFHYVESLRPSKSDLRDPGYICWDNGLPYELEFVIAPACAELLKIEEAIDA